MRDSAVHLALLHHFRGNGTELLVGVRVNGRKRVMTMHTPMHMLDDEIAEAKTIAAGFFCDSVGHGQIRFYVDGEDEFIAGSFQEFIDKIDEWHLGWMADMQRDLHNAGG